MFEGTSVLWREIMKLGSKEAETKEFQFSWEGKSVGMEVIALRHRALLGTVCHPVDSQRTFRFRVPGHVIACPEIGLINAWLREFLVIQAISSIDACLKKATASILEEKSSMVGGDEERLRTKSIGSSVSVQGAKVLYGYSYGEPLELLLNVGIVCKNHIVFNFQKIFKIPEHSPVTAEMETEIAKFIGYLLYIHNKFPHETSF